MPFSSFEWNSILSYNLRTHQSQSAEQSVIISVLYRGFGATVLGFYTRALNNTCCYQNIFQSMHPFGENNKQNKIR